MYELRGKSTKRTPRTEDRPGKYSLKAEMKTFETGKFPFVLPVWCYNRTIRRNASKFRNGHIAQHRRDGIFRSFVTIYRVRFTTTESTEV